MRVADANFPSVPESREAIENWVFDKLKGIVLDDATTNKIALSLEEAVINAIRHGNESNPDKKVMIGLVLDMNRLYIRVTDEGPGFDLDSVPDPTIDKNLEADHGRGILLMRTYADEVVYSKAGNSVKLGYFLNI